MRANETSREAHTIFLYVSFSGGFFFFLFYVSRIMYPLNKSSFYRSVSEPSQNKKKKNARFHTPVEIIPDHRVRAMLEVA